MDGSAGGPELLSGAMLAMYIVKCAPLPGEMRCAVKVFVLRGRAGESEHATHHGHLKWHRTVRGIIRTSLGSQPKLYSRE